MLAVLVICAAAPLATASVLRSGGSRIGVQAINPASQTTLMDPLDGTPQGVVYHGGPVLHGVTTYAIFWDPAGAFSSSEESLVSGFLANAAHDSGGNANVFSVAAQYTDAAGAARYAQTYGGSFVDTDPYPASADCSETTPSASTCLYDSQGAAEIASFAASHNLPVGMNSLYVLLTPASVVTCIDGGDQCSDNAYCSVHSYASDGSSTLLYIEIPFTLLGPAGDPKSCQDDGNSALQAPNGNGGYADVALKSLSHEMLETISDPLLNAWYDADGNEVADLCNGMTWNPGSFLPLEGGNAAAGTLWNQTINGAHYYLQGAWSNQTNSCALAGAPTPTFAAPAPAVAGTTDSFTANSGTNASVSSYSWSFGDGQSTTGLSVTHAYAAAGEYTVTLSVTDSFGNTGTVSEQVDVTAPAGKTAGASGSHTRARSDMRCGTARRVRGGAERRHCTKTSVWHSSSRTIVRRAACVEVRPPTTGTWSQRCAPAVVVSSRA